MNNFERIVTNKQRRGYQAEQEHVERKRKQRQHSRRAAQSTRNIIKCKLYEGREVF